MFMANTYTQSYFHLVFAVKHREALIKKSWKNELEMYITGIVQNHKHKLLAIGSCQIISTFLLDTILMS